jgi:hypothetical protein
MKRITALSLLLLTGCSTAPIADLLDFVRPGRITPGPAPYGGVCIPQGGPVGAPVVAAPVLPGPGIPPPPAPPGAPGAPVVVTPPPLPAGTQPVPFPGG